MKQRCNIGWENFERNKLDYTHVYVYTQKRSQS